jgi:transcriptional regulator with XRE-family HTH domain
MKTRMGALERARREAKLTLRMLGQRLSMGISTLSKLENFVLTPSEKTAKYFHLFYNQMGIKIGVQEILSDYDKKSK